MLGPTFCCSQWLNKYVLNCSTLYTIYTEKVWNLLVGKSVSNQHLYYRGEIKPLQKEKSSLAQTLNSKRMPQCTLHDCSSDPLRGFPPEGSGSEATLVKFCICQLSFRIPWQALFLEREKINIDHQEVQEYLKAKSLDNSINTLIFDVADPTIVHHGTHTAPRNPAAYITISLLITNTSVWET